MAGHKKKSPGLDIEYYVVAFVDLLGQQEHLRALTDLPDKNDPVKMDLFRNALKQTYGVVTGMRQTFERFFNSYSRRHISQFDLSRLPHQQRKLFSELKSNPIQFQRFSDSMVIFLSLRTDKFKLPARGIFGMLGAAATSFLVGLAAGHPIRGGIELGVAMEMTKGEIYGAALARAYALESKIAMYPRIVIGGELIRYLQLTLSQESDDIYAKTGKHAAQLCLDMTAIDDDGQIFLDYLGSGFKRHIASELNIEVIRRAYQHVLDRSEKYQREQNTTLAFRYTLLRSYFEDRLPLWVSESSKVSPVNQEDTDQQNEMATQPVTSSDGSAAR